MHDGDVAGHRAVIEQRPPDPAGRAKIRAALSSGAGAMLRNQGRNIGLFLALIIGVAVVGIPHPAYLTIANFKVIGLESAYTMIAALGTTFLMIGGNIDLSIGSNLGLAAVVSALLANDVGSVGAIVLGILVAGLVGLVNGLLVWRVKLSPLIITLGSLTALQGVTDVLTGGAQVYQVPASFSKFGLATPLGIPSALAIAIVFIPIGYVLLNRTTFGQYTFAIGANRAASTATGLNVRRLVLVTFAINGLLIGLIGTLQASRFASADPTFGTGFELDVITAVILGGVAFSGGEGGIAGVVIAVLLLGVVDSSFVWLGISAFYTNVVKGLVLIFAVTLDQIAHEQRARYQKMVAMRERAADAGA
jgi:ribose transport system permease protein